MPNTSRNGGRQQRSTGWIPVQCEHYLVVTDAKGTEQHYLNGLKKSLPADQQNKLSLRVFQTNNPADFIAECKRIQNLEPGYVNHTWIVFDYDERPQFDTIIKDAKKEGFSTGWSNPCIEVWFSAYFGELCGEMSSQRCQDMFKVVFKQKIKCTYTKENKKIYEYLSREGDEVKAIERADWKYHEHKRNGIDIPSKMCPGTTIYLLIKEIRDKCLISELNQIFVFPIILPNIHQNNIPSAPILRYKIPRP